MAEPYEIKDIIDETANDLVQVLPYTSGLRGWVVYFLETLEAETKDPQQYQEMLADLVTDIQLRIDSGKW